MFRRSSAAAASCAKSNGGFSSNLIASFVQEKKQFVVSPYSLASCLRLAYLGAGEGGGTKDQLAAAAEEGGALKYNSTKHQPPLYRFYPIGSLTEYNSVLIPEAISVPDSYKKAVIADKTPGAGNVAEVTAINNDPDLTAAKVNALAEKYTNGEITKVVTSDDFAKPSVVLMNALYFKADWRQPFDKQVTVKVAPFHSYRSSASTTILDKMKKEKKTSVSLMELHDERFLYKEDGGSQYLQLQYKADAKQYAALEEDGKVSSAETIPAVENPIVLVLELPADKKTFPTLEKLVGPTAAVVTGFLSGFSYSDVSLKLPKFRVEHTVQGLKERLEDPTSIGVCAPFDPAKADFSPSFGTAIGKIIQKVVFDVDEKGTTAAAVTVACVLESAMAKPPPIPFHCDRTFGYALVHKPTGTTLFAGVFDGEE